MAPSRIVKPPRVALPPVALECTYCQTVVLTGSDGKTTGKSVVIVEVNIYIDHRVIAWMFDVRRMRGSLGSAYMDYCVVDDVFTMQRV